MWVEKQMTLTISFWEIQDKNQGSSEFSLDGRDVRNYLSPTFYLATKETEVYRY